MERPVRALWVGSALIALVLLAGASGVHAASAHIAFSGAVVEPTCTVDTVTADPVPRVGQGAVPTRHSCGRTATDPGRAYSRVVTHLAPADLGHDRLLAYFASYAHRGPGDEATVKVVVHTYD